MLKHLRILGDAPFDDVSERDPLGYDDFIDSLVDIVINSKNATPFAIGIQGDWGTGKTTAMRRLQEKLKHENCLTIWFNPWKYREKEEVWKGLIKTIFDEIPKDLSKKVMEKWKNIALVGTDRFLGQFGMDGIISEIKSIFELNARFINEFETIMEDTIGQLLKEKEKNLLIIFIDDLDRCRPECSIRILEAIKLYLSIPQCAFVIGFDIDVIEKGIKAIYGKDSEISGTNYIKKIIQLPFRVPKPGKEEIKKYTEACIENIGASEIFSEENKIKSEYMDTIIQGTNSNPREVKRFLNSFVFLHNIKQERISDYDPKKLIYLLLTQLRWHDLFRLIDENKHLMMRIQDYTTGDENIKETLGDELKLLLGREDFLKFTENNLPNFKSVGELERYLKHSTLSRAEKPIAFHGKYEADTFNQMGLIYKERGDLKNALNNFEFALKLYQEIGDLENIATSLENIGIIYREKGNLDRALRYHEEALKINRKTGDKQGETLKYLRSLKKESEESKEVSEEFPKAMKEGE